MAKVATVLMTRKNWTAVCQCLITCSHKLIDRRDPAYRDDELEQTIRDYVQKLVPIIYLAADKESYPEITDLYKEMLDAAGYVVPEHFEDMGKGLVQIDNDYK